MDGNDDNDCDVVCVSDVVDNTEDAAAADDDSVVAHNKCTS